MLKRWTIGIFSTLKGKNSNFCACYFLKKILIFLNLDTAEFDRMNSKRYIATKNTMEDQINFDFLFLIKFNSFIY